MTPISAKVLKNPGEFDWDAATVVDPNTNDAGPLDSNPVLGREEALSLLFQKIAQLPLGPKKVLAMHYHEHIPGRGTSTFHSISTRFPLRHQYDEHCVEYAYRVYVCNFSVRLQEAVGRSHATELAKPVSPRQLEATIG